MKVLGLGTTVNYLGREFVIKAISKGGIILERGGAVSLTFDLQECCEFLSKGEMHVVRL